MVGTRAGTSKQSHNRNCFVYNVITWKKSERIVASPTHQHSSRQMVCPQQKKIPCESACFAQSSSTLLTVHMSPSATCKRVRSIVQMHVMLWVVGPWILRLLHWILVQLCSGASSRNSSMSWLSVFLHTTAEGA